MQFDKSAIVDLLRGQGRDQDAQAAEQQFPAQVDHEQHADLLNKLGINPQDLVSKLGGVGKLLGQ